MKMIPTKEQLNFIQCCKTTKVYYKFLAEQPFKESEVFNLNKNGEFEIGFIQHLFLRHLEHGCLRCQAIPKRGELAFKYTHDFMTSKDTDYLLDDKLNTLNPDKSPETEHLKYAILALMHDEISFVEEYSPIEQVFSATCSAVRYKAMNLITNAFSTNENREDIEDLITEIIYEDEINKDDIEYLITALQEKLKSL